MRSHLRSIQSHSPEFGHFKNAIEYLSAGLPVISCPQKGELYNLLKERNCGLSYKHSDADGLFQLLDQLNRNRAAIIEMSVNATALFKERFTAEKVYSEMACYIEKIAKTFSFELKAPVILSATFSP